jgi:flagellar biosynthetic protein FliR
MNFEPILPWLLSVGMLTIRLTVALALSPAIAAFGVPASVRVALTIALAGLACDYHSLAPAAAAWAADPARMLLPVIAEMLIGALLGLTVQMVLAALSLAGRLLDVQIGFSIGSVFDPVTGAASNVLGAITGLLGVTLFVVSDAHLQLVQLIAQSIDVFPLGQFPQLHDPLRIVLAGSSMFTLGLSLAAPVVAALLLTDLAIGVASRNMPQVNVLILGWPLKILVGYLMLALSVRGWGPLVAQGFARTSGLLGMP